VYRLPQYDKGALRIAQIRRNLYREGGVLITTGVPTRNVPTPLKVALAIGVLLILCMGGAGVLLVGQGFAGTSYIDGRVVDSRTGTPLQGAAVVVSNRGWGFLNGQLVWDKDYVYPTVSDQNGQFHIVFDVGSSAHVKTAKAGYLPQDSWYERNSTITIPLQAISPTTKP
jgi:hypothetical protein